PIFEQNLSRRGLNTRGERCAYQASTCARLARLLILWIRLHHHVERMAGAGQRHIEAAQAVPPTRLGSLLSRELKLGHVEQLSYLCRCIGERSGYPPRTLRAVGENASGCPGERGIQLRQNDNVELQPFRAVDRHHPDVCSDGVAHALRLHDRNEVGGAQRCPRVVAESKLGKLTEPPTIPCTAPIGELGRNLRQRPPVPPLQQLAAGPYRHPPCG